MEVFGLLSLICCFGIFGMLFNFAAAYWVYNDSKSLNIPDGFVWVILAFVAPFIGLLVYFLGIRPSYSGNNIKSAQSKTSTHKKDPPKQSGPIERVK